MNAQQFHDKSEAPSLAKITGPATVPLPYEHVDRLDCCQSGVVVYRSVQSQFLELTRDIFLYRPPGFDTSTQESCSLLIMLDGQNLFAAEESYDGISWELGGMLDLLIDNKETAPLLLCGIGSTSDRLKEYSTAVDPNFGGGEGNFFQSFLTNELLPTLSILYPCLDMQAGTAIAGSSIGALIALDCALEYPSIFRKVAALSPSLFWAERYIFDKALQQKWHAERLWLDIGDAEHDFVEIGAKGAVRDLREFSKLLETNQNESNSKVHCQIHSGLGHNVKAWSERMPGVFRYLFPYRKCK